MLLLSLDPWVLVPLRYPAGPDVHALEGHHTRSESETFVENRTRNPHLAGRLCDGEDLDGLGLGRIRQSWAQGVLQPGGEAFVNTREASPSVVSQLPRVAFPEFGKGTGLLLPECPSPKEGPPGLASGFWEL